MQISPRPKYLAIFLLLGVSTLLKAESNSCPVNSHIVQKRSEKNALSEANLTKSLTEAEQSANPRLVIESMEALWEFYNNSDEREKALKIGYIMMERIKGTSINIRYEARLLMQFTSSLIHSGRFNEAQKLLNKGLELVPSEEHEIHGDLLFNKAFIYGEVGEHELAIRFYNMANAKFLKFEPPILKGDICSYKDTPPLGLASSMLQVASQLSHLGKYKKAKSNAVCAKDILQNTDNYYAIASIAEYAKILRRDGALVKAAEFATKVLQNSNARAPQKIDALAILLEKNINESSKIELIEQYKHIEKNTFKILNTNSDCSTADIVIYLQQLLDAAEGFYNIDFSATYTVNFPVKLIDIYRLLIKWHSKTSQPELVDLLAEKALALIEKYQVIVNNPVAWRNARHGLLDSYLSAKLLDPDSMTEPKKLQLASFIDHNFSFSPDQKNFNLNFSENKSTVLQEKYEKWIQAEREWFSHIQSNEKFTRYQIDLSKDLFFSSALRELLPTVFASPHSLKYIQQSIPLGTIALRYVVTKSKSFIIVLSRDSIEYLSIPNQKEIGILLSEIQHNLQYTEKFMHALTAALLPSKIFRNRKLNKLVIIADGQLQRLPFSLLNIAESSEQYIPLVAKYEIVYTHSMTKYFIGNIQKAGKNNLFSIAVFANPQFSSMYNSNTNSVRKYGIERKYPRLLGTQLEADAIQKIFQLQKMSIATKEKANSKFLMSQSTRSASILHIASHGFYNPKYPDIVGILSTPTQDEPRGFLSVNQLLGEKIDSQLVVISGCETNLGKSFGLSNMLSMTNGFLAQGAKSVIGTLWPIQDRATAEFMKKFYEYLLITKNSVSALQKTQESFARQGRYRHPKYWAGFVLTVSNQQYESINLN